MINNHRPATPAGVCLSGSTVRCTQCERPGALEGYLRGVLVVLCSCCGHGYAEAGSKRAGGFAKFKPVPTPEKDIRKRVLVPKECVLNRLKRYRKAHALSWKLLVMLLNNTTDDLEYTVSRLATACSSKNKPSPDYLKKLTKALDDLEAKA